MEPLEVSPELVRDELARVEAMKEFRIVATQYSFQVHDNRRKGRHYENTMIIDADFYPTLWENMVHGLGLIDNNPLSKYLAQYLVNNPLNK